MGYVVMACVGMTCVAMAYVVMAYVVMAYVVMAYVVMAYVVMALCSYGLCSDGLCSDGPCIYDLCSYGLYSYGLYSYGLYCWYVGCANTCGAVTTRQFPSAYEYEPHTGRMPLALHVFRMFSDVIGPMYIRTVMAYIVVAYIVCEFNSYGIYGYGPGCLPTSSDLCGCGMYRYGTYSYGMDRYGLYSYGLCSPGPYSYGLYNYGGLFSNTVGHMVLSEMHGICETADEQFRCDS